jgi:outer membrane protein TolC
VLYRDRLTPEMESLLESTWTAYVNGSAGIADVVDVQRTSLELRLAEADAHRDRAYALGDLTRVTGVDWLHAEETP